MNGLKLTLNKCFRDSAVSVALVLVIAGGMLSACSWGVPPVPTSLTPASLKAAQSTPTSLLALTASPSAFVMPSATPEAGRELHVSPQGSDKEGDGSSLRPWQTVQHCADLAQPGDTCLIHAGIYRETVRPARSGTAGLPIRFEAYGNDRVTLSGADVVTGWTPTGGDIFQAGVDWTLGRGKDQVFINGSAAVEARFPNEPDAAWAYPLDGLSPLWPVRGAFASNAEQTQDEDRFRFTSDRLLNQPKDTWKGAIYVGWHYQGWSAETGIIASSQPGAFMLDPSSLTKRWFCTYLTCYASWYPDNGHGYITGTKNALDVPNEWFLDPESQILSLMLPAGVDPARQVIEVKRRQLAFDLRQRSYIEIRGLNVFASSITTAQGSHISIDRCRMEYISHFTQIADGREGWVDTTDGILDSTVVSQGLVGIYLGGEENSLTHSILRYSAGAGVILQGSRHVIYNNLVEEVSYAGTYLSSIFITYDPAVDPDPSAIRGGHIISFNTLNKAGRSLIHVNGMGSAPDLSAATHYSALTITHNLIENGMLLSNDGGLIYGYGVALGTNENPTEIAYNVIHDSFNAANGALVYWDNGTWMVHNHHNLLWGAPNTSQVDHAFNTGGDDRTWENNEFKVNYSGGVSALGDADFPFGRFDFGYSPASLQSSPVQPSFTPTPVVPDIFLEAEASSLRNGVIDLSNLIGGCDPDDWLAFEGVYLASGYRTLTMRAIIPTSNAGQRVEIRLDAPTGPILGELTTLSPTDSGQFVIQKTSLQPVSGTHSLYIVCAGSGRVGGFDWFRLSDGSGATATPAPRAVNLALKRPVEVSSLDETGSDAKWAVDGNEKTRWTSRAFEDPQWITIDLGSSLKIGRVILRWEAAYALAYRLQVSDYPDGPWKDGYVETNGNGSVDDLQNLTVSGRYLRILGEKRGSKWGYSLWEVEAYSPQDAFLAQP